ncbi:fumarylacetoacetate hydrolase family protein [Acidobacteriota bacterium]
MENSRCYYRFEHLGAISFGVYEEEKIRLVEGDIFGPHRVTDTVVNLEDVRILCPCQPSKIVAVGLNYKDHAKERSKPVPREPLIFLKAPSAVIGPDEPIRLPRWAGRIDHEGELGIVIGRTARYVSADEAESYILGYTCFNDVTARELQDRDIQFSRAKSFDTFAPMGPSVTSLPLVEVEQGLQIELSVDGQVRQTSTTANMLFPVSSLIQFITRVMTLLPGDIIATGTPSGIGSLKDGDEVQVTIEKIGMLRNPVVLE